MPSQSTMPLYGKSAMPLYGITNILSSHTNKEEAEEVPLSLGYYYYIKPEMESYHIHALLPNQCGSILVQTIDAPLPLVWSILRQFDNPQAYKQFITSCTMRTGSGGIGSIREVMVSSGLPAKTSMERLDKLDDDKHVMDFSIVGGEHRLANYSCTTTVQEKKGRKTVVIQSYVVDVPAGSSKEDTCLFANTIIGCNLRSLAKVTEKMAD